MVKANTASAGYGAFYANNQPTQAPPRMMTRSPPMHTATAATYASAPVYYNNLRPPHALSPTLTMPPPRGGLPYYHSVPPPAPVAPWSYAQTTTQSYQYAARPPPVSYTPPPPSIYQARGPMRAAAMAHAQTLPMTQGRRLSMAAPVVATTMIAPTPSPVLKKPGPNDWPPSLRAYVGASFSRCTNANDKNTVQSAIKILIQTAMDQNTLWSTDWSCQPKIPLPSDVVTPVVPLAPLPQPPRVTASVNPWHNVPVVEPASSSRWDTKPTFPVTAALSPFDNGFISIKSPPMTSKKKKRAQHFAMEDTASQRHDRVKKQQREARFAADGRVAPTMYDPYTDSQANAAIFDQSGEMDLDAMTIKGSCDTVEKGYLRLTSAPLPTSVRPERILKRALALVKEKWSDLALRDYVYARSQLKSLRQDLMVQRIKSHLTVDVYETHGRIALQMNDMNEFNQCQTQLKEHYAAKLHPNDATRQEFVGYGILYCVFTAMSNPSSSAIGMNLVLINLVGPDQTVPCVVHALAVRQAVASNDYHGFFNLYAKVPYLGAFIMDAMATHVRLSALRVMMRAYSPSLDLAFIRQELNLSKKQGTLFLKMSGLVLSSLPLGVKKMTFKSPGATVDCKLSKIVTSMDKTSLI